MIYDAGFRINCPFKHHCNPSNRLHFATIYNISSAQCTKKKESCAAAAPTPLRGAYSLAMLNG